MTDTAKAATVELYAMLNANGIAYAHHTHPPLFTVEDSRALRGELPGGHVKNTVSYTHLTLPTKRIV